MSILPQFWASDTSEVTKGLLGQIQNLHFTTVLNVRHVRSDERVAAHGYKFAFYHSFERPTRPNWRKGSIRDVTNLRFTSVLSVRHVRSDERVDPRRHKFAFYHSFERPTRTKWREGRSATSKICVLPQFWASDTHEVTRGLSNPQVRSLRPRQKKNIF